MKNIHITKAIALVMTVIMLIGIVPSSVLPVFALSGSEQSTSIFDNVTLGKGTVTNTESYMAGVATDKTQVSKIYSPYEPYETQNENHPFLPGGSAYIDHTSLFYGAPATQNFPVTDWSANTSVYNITETGETYASGMVKGEKIYLFPDHDLIDRGVWRSYQQDARLNDQGNGSTYLENGAVDSTVKDKNISIVDARNGEVAYAYNRYDPAMGKYGITLDKNVKMARWSPSYLTGYYPNDEAYFGSVVNISDTPYLYFSTEAPETTQIAISILIGTPVQKEVGYSNGTKTTNTGYFEYRWYTITDNSARPGIDADTRNLSMTPKVTVSEPVGVFKGNSDTYLTAYQQQNDTIIPALRDANKMDPIALAEAAGVNTDTLFTDGSITGCYDFSNILPTICGSWYQETVNGKKEDRDKGREDAMFKVSQIRVDVRTAGKAEPSASRINYLYFGPSLVTTYLPQTTDGAQVSAANWQYAQNGTTNSVGVSNAVGTSVIASSNTSTERGYTSGWENGAAVSIVNTPENPQLYTVDIHGKGDGKLIDWSEVPASANIRRDDNKKTTKVWKFTDNNNVVQYMEAEEIGDPNGSESTQVIDNYVVMVTIPVRKWANILGEARKVSLTAKVLNYGKDATGKTNTALRPSFTFWGNDDGALGYGHGGLGTRFRHEDILMVFGQKYQVYHTDSSGDYICAEVDRTVGDSTIYNTNGNNEESWYDYLRSPYTYDQTVKYADTAKGLNANHAGYAFITSLRFAMPIDSAISIQNMKGDGNSAGLNTYSATGEIVTAYDGGTGSQPEMNVTNSLTAKKVTISKKTSSASKPTDYNYTIANGETIKGTINVGDAAAYGPMLKESYYTIYDLLDTELITATGAGSHAASNTGKANIPVYGDKWKNNKNAVVPIYSSPNTSSSIYGYVYENCECTIYYRLNITNSSGSNIESWGLTGVLTKSGMPELGWVPLWISGGSYSFTHTGGTMIKVESMTRDKVPNNWYVGRNQLTALKNSWALSNLNGGYGGNFLGYKDGSYGFTYGCDVNGNADKGKYIYPQDIHHPAYTNHDGYDGNTLHYANCWNDPVTGTNSGPNVRDAYLYTKNGTDLVFGMKRSANTTTNWSVGMSRIFSNPITLKQGLEYVHGSYPVLYVDYDVTSGKNNSAIIALSLLVDGKEPVLYHVYGNSSAGITTAHHGLTLGSRVTRYISFEDVMNAYSGHTLTITGLSLYMWTGSTDDKQLEMTLRRCEVWQEETDWLDTILSPNQQQGGNTSTAMNAKVYDSMNIVNDAFYNVHNEKADGSYTVTKSTDTYAALSGFGKDGEPIFNITKNTNSNSLKKQNSNKGWQARLVINDDSNKATVGGNDTTYNSHDGYGSLGTYQYSTAVGNLRFWCPANTDGSLIFESDRSYGIGNYRYLYYSYSMRDVDTGISAEDRVDGETITDKGPGLALAIKSTTLGSSESYLEQTVSGTRTLAYYADGQPYWSEDGRDARTYVTATNAAIDLSTLKNINSVNQFVFYFNNPYDKRAEFYINYIKLSNEPPETLISNRLEKEGTQYYYMMDNTGDRYSARFPTIDNPTGLVTGLTDNASRVNPIIIGRGDRISDGKYFNGDNIYGYSTYDKNYGATDGYSGSMKNIMFYETNSNAEDDISDFYTYKERNGDGTGNIYDMKWSYGRWDLGSGVSALNTMYIGNPDDLGENDTANVISGSLTRRYATENYVLLRAGIEPRMYTTTFDANGGEFIYDSSPDDIASLKQVTENNYYITNDHVLEYYNHPASRPAMKGENGDITECLKKPGFIFSHWEHYTNYNTVNNNFNPNAASGEKSHFKPYVRKAKAENDYFKAVWIPDPNATQVYTATFLDTNNKSFKEIPVGVGYDKCEVKGTPDPNYKYGRFVLEFPNITVLYSGHEKQHIYGWKVKNDTSANPRVYSPGERIYLFENTTFVPVVDGDSANTFDITLIGATLYVKSTTLDSNGNNIFRPAEFFGIKHVKSGNEYVYSNVPENFSLKAVPVTATTNYGWVLVNNSDYQKINLISGNVSVVSDNKAEYTFTAHENTTISYSSVSSYKSNTFYKSQQGVFATVSPRLTTDADNKPAVYFTSQFQLASDCTYLAAGTMITKSSYYDAYGSAADSKMRIDTATIKSEADITNRTFKAVDTKGIKIAHASAFSSNFEYTAYIAHSKEETIIYYARAYVIYKQGSTIKVAYSDVVAWDEGSYVAPVAA